MGFVGRFFHRMRGGFRRTEGIRRKPKSVAVSLMEVVERGGFFYTKLHCVL